MYRCLTKFIVALLVILGDCAFTTEYRNTTDSYSPQLSQSEHAENFNLDPQTPLPCSLPNKILSTQITNYYALTITLSEEHTHQHSYSTFSPRAPPATHQII